MSNNQKLNRLLLLSFPRSGSVFLLYCLQYCLKTYRVNQSPQLKDFIDTIEDFEPANEVQIFKEHEFKNIAQHDVAKNFTLFILRDFKECILSQCIQVNSTDYARYASIYCDQVLAFQQWENKKHCIHYEDFIENPIDEVASTIELFNKDYSPMIVQFEKVFSELNNASLTLKKRLGSPSLSGGKKKKFHAQEGSTDVTKELERLVKERLSGTPAFDLVARYF